MKHLALASTLLIAIPATALAQRPASAKHAASATEVAVRLAD